MRNQTSFKKLLAVVLTVTTIATNFSIPVYANEISENIASSNEISTSEEESSEVTSAEASSTSVDVTSSDSEEASNEILSADEVLDSQTVDSIESTGSQLGASDLQIQTAEKLMSTSELLGCMTPGVDYSTNEVYFEADSDEEAQRIAKEYNGELKSFEYGIGTIEFSLSGNETLATKLKDEASICSVDTPVYPDYILSYYGFNEQDKVSFNGILSSKDASVLSYSYDAYSDPLYTKGYQWFHAGIDTKGAWALGYKGKGVLVGVLDSGVDTDHEDLVDNMAGAITVTDSDSAEDENGHGTNVAGIIAEVGGNNKGGVGVAPEAKIYSVKIADAKGEVQLSDEIKGIKAAISRGVDVINLSVGRAGFVYYNGVKYSTASSSEQSALDAAAAAGITVVAAAGNDSTDVIAYPAACNNVISVAAYDSDANLTSFSNYGSWVDIVAPGDAINATGINNDYVGYKGTSQASPMVAGIAALVYSTNDSYISTNTSATTKTVTSKVINTAWNHTFTYTTDSNVTHSVTGGAMASSAVSAKDNSDIIIPKKPTISLSTDSITGAVTVKFKTSTSGDGIRYTIVGTYPDDTEGTCKSGDTLYFSSGAYTIKAREYNCYAESDAVTVNVKVVVPKTVATQATQLYCKTGSILLITPGKSFKPTMIIGPSNIKNKKLFYTISDNQAGNDITVSNSGKISVKKTAVEGEALTLIVHSQSNASLTYNIRVIVGAKVSKLVSLSKNAILYTNGNNIFNWNVTTYGVSGNTADSVIEYTSSNTNIAQVNMGGAILALGTGKATITAKTTDGSNLKTTLKVDCRTYQTGVKYKIYGQSFTSSNTGTGEVAATEFKICKGTSTKISATALGYEYESKIVKPSNKNVTYTLKDISGNGMTGITISKSGVLKCSKTSPSTTFEVIMSLDNGNKSIAVKFSSVDKPSSILAVTASKTYTNSCMYTNTLGTVVNLDTFDGEATIKSNRNGVYTIDDMYSKTFSNKKYVSVYTYKNQYPSTVMFLRKGKYNVTYKAMDGSNKTFKLQVVIK